MQTEYISALVLLIVSVLKIFKIEIENQVITGIVTGLIALWIAFKTKKKETNILGFAKS